MTEPMEQNTYSHLNPQDKQFLDSKQKHILCSEIHYLIFCLMILYLVMYTVTVSSKFPL